MSQLIKVNIIGSGGHARSLLSLIGEGQLIQVNGIFDESFSFFPNEKIGNTQLIGGIDSLHSLSDSIILAVGNIEEKIELVEKFKSTIFIENLISNSALVRKDVILGVGNHVFPFAFLNSEVEIGNHCIINSRATIEHESKIGNFCHISVGAIICGRVIIGDNSFIGAGSIVKDGVKICDNVIVGAGAVVLKDVNSSGTYIGNPLRKIK